GDSGCDSTGGLAAVERNARESCRQAHSGLFLRGLLPGPWGHGNRFEYLGGEIRQPCDLCVARGMGRPNYCRVRRDSADSGRVVGNWKTDRLPPWTHSGWKERKGLRQRHADLEFCCITDTPKWNFMPL